MKSVNVDIHKVEIVIDLKLGNCEVTTVQGEQSGKVTAKFQGTLASFINKKIYICVIYVSSKFANRKMS